MKHSDQNVVACNLKQKIPHSKVKYKHTVEACRAQFPVYKFYLQCQLLKHDLL